MLILNITVELELLSECWDAILNDFDMHDLTNEYPGTSQISSASVHVFGWNICWNSPQYDSNAFSLGKYKLSTEIEIDESTTYSDYCYFDYRTSDLPEEYQASADIHMYLNIENGQLFWDADFTQPLGTSYTIWGLSQYIDQITTELEPYAPDNFALNNSGAYPYLSWSFSSEVDYWTNFAIYRSVVSNDNPPGEFTKIATLGKLTTNYSDDDYSCGGPLTAYYKITTVNGDRESAFSNTLNTGVGLYKEGNGVIPFENQLNQNYPNPFNPTTAIKYSIEKTGIVNLTVYDMLGKTVQVLVNEIQESGIYNIGFNAHDMPSGVYFYVLKTNSFQATRKLLVIK
jgi:hypothetical protein